MNDNPFTKPITSFELVTPKITEDGLMSVVVLERIEPGVTPDYCVHGKTACHKCGDWCWLGSETYKVVTGGAVGLCIECAHKTLPPDRRPAERLEDH